ncbi:MAG: hypothetical protein KDI44_01615 [Thiothrix sp.]|nr:hypothetical protein [Thiothrix sp.]HPQ93964.1 hypothetical protein [Thiolinea sp.]
MKNTLVTTLAASLLMSAFSAPVLAGPVAATEKLWFSAPQVSAFYTLDEANHQVVVTARPGPGSKRGLDKPVARTATLLEDGGKFMTAMYGEGDNAPTATLIVTRDGDRLEAFVSTFTMDADTGQTVSRLD